MNERVGSGGTAAEAVGEAGKDQNQGQSPFHTQGRACGGAREAQPGGDVEAEEEERRLVKQRTVRPRAATGHWPPMTPGHSGWKTQDV